MMYCENAECRVELYRDTLVEEMHKDSLIGDPRLDNCPGCGQFGRKKGKQ